MRNKWSRIVVCTLAMMLAMTGLAACGTPAATPAAGTATAGATVPETATVAPTSQGNTAVELKYFGWNDEKPYLQPIIEAFNAANPDTKVVPTFMVPDDYYAKILTMLTSGAADLDIYSVNGTANLVQYQQVGGLLDLTNYITKNNVDVSKYGPSMQSLLIDGKSYVLPYRSSCYALFYNKDIFDKAGEPYPNNITWEEYAQIAKRLTSGEGATKIWGGFIPDWLSAPIMPLQMDSNLLDDDVTPIVKWMELLNRVYNVDKSHMSFAEMRSTKVDWIKFFETGTVAMLPNGEWTVSLLNDDKAAGKHNVNWDVALIPVVNKGDTVKSAGGVSTFFGIYSGSKNADAAFRFLQFACGGDGAKIMAEKGVLPAFINDDIKAAFVKAAGVPGADALLSAETYPETQNIPQMAAVLQAYTETLELYLTGQITIEKFKEEFVSRRSEALAQ